MSVQKKSQTTDKVKPVSKKRSKKTRRSETDKFIPVMSRKGVPPINTKNDFGMVQEKLRLPLIDRDPEWHKKTSEEREILLGVSKIKNLRASSSYKKENLLKYRIIVYLKNPLKLENFKTTYSEIVEICKVKDYLKLYFSEYREKKQIHKIFYNGKAYNW